MNNGTIFSPKSVSLTPLHEAGFFSTRTSTCHFDEVPEWLSQWTANPFGSARVVFNPIFVAAPHWFYGVMVSTLDFESSDLSSNQNLKY